MPPLEYVVWASSGTPYGYWERSFGTAPEARAFYEELVAKLQAEELLLTKPYGSTCSLPAVHTTVRVAGGHSAHDPPVGKPDAN